MTSIPGIRPDPKIDALFQPPKIDTRQLTREMTLRWAFELTNFNRKKNVSTNNKTKFIFLITDMCTVAVSILGNHQKDNNIFPFERHTLRAAHFSFASIEGYPHLRVIRPLKQSARLRRNSLKIERSGWQLHFNYCIFIACEHYLKNLRCFAIQLMPLEQCIYLVSET